MSKPATCVLVLACLMALAGWGRWTSASNVFDPSINTRKSLYFDEVVYIALGQNLLNRGDYSLRMQHANMTNLYRQIPRYVNDPLFKHPPLVPVLVAGAMKPFSNNVRAAFLPGMIAGLAMLAVLFLTARELCRDQRVAWLATALLAASPTHWICSAKIMLEAPLAFFVLAAVAAQFAAVRKPAWHWVAGLAWALAAWTKYTALPLWAMTQAGLLFAYPRLLNDRRYRWSQVLAALLLTPWVAWRFQVDGVRLLLFWESPTEEWEALTRQLGRPSRWAMAAAAVGAAWWAVAARRRVWKVLLRGRWMGRWPGWFAAVGLVLLVAAAVLCPETAGFGSLPWHGSDRNLLAREPFYTYVLRQAAFEPLALVGMTAGLFMAASRRMQVVKFLAVAGTVMVTVWGNYQMRYFLPLIPFWSLLSAAALFAIARGWERENPWLARAYVWLWVAVSLGRSLWIDWRIAIPNNCFYF